MGQSAGHVAAADTAVCQPADHSVLASQPVGISVQGLSHAPSTSGSLDVTRPNGGYSAAGCPHRAASFASSRHSFSAGGDVAVDQTTVTMPQLHLADATGVDPNLWAPAPNSSSTASASSGSRFRPGHATVTSFRGPSSMYDRAEGGERAKLSFNDNVETYVAADDDGYCETMSNSSRTSQHAQSSMGYGAYGSGLHPLYEDPDATWQQPQSDFHLGNLSGLGPRAYALPEGDMDNTWDSVPSAYSSLHNAAMSSSAYAPPYRENSAAASSCSPAAVEARQRQSWQVGSILEVFSSTSGIWNIARVMQVREGEDADVLTVKFYVEDGPKQKLLLRSDSQLALLGRNTGGKLPPGFKIKASQSHPGEAVYFDATTGSKYASLDMAWQTHFERLMLQPAESIQTVKALAPLQAAMPVVAPAAAAMPSQAADGPKKWMTVQEMHNLKRGPQRQPQEHPGDPHHVGKVALPQFDENGQAQRAPAGLAAMPQPSFAAPYPLLQAQARPPPYPMVANDWQGARVR